jgi:TP901 family phage tail tape measure protein
MAEIKESVILEVGTKGATEESNRLTQAFDKLTTVLEKIEKQLDKKTQVNKEVENAERKVGVEAKRTGEIIDRQTGIIGRNEAGLRRTRATLSETARAFSAQAAAAQGALGPISRMALLLGGGLGIRAVVQDLAAFDRGLTQLRVVSGGTVAEIDRIKQAALELGATTPKSASEALAGAVELAKAGFSAVAIPEALPAALNLAVTAQIELGRAAEITAVALKQFGLEADEAVRVTDALTVAASSGVVDVADLAEALTYAGTIGGAFGFQLEDVVAALGALGEGGLKGGIAGRGLAGVLSRLLDPAGDAAAALDKVKMTTDQLDPSVVGFADAIRNLSRALSQGANVFALFDTEQAKSAVTLGKQVEAFERFAAAQRESIDAAGDQVEAFGGDLQGSLTKFSSALDGLKQKVGDNGLTGGLKTVVGLATDVVVSLGTLGEEGERASRGAQLAASAVEGLAAAFASLAVLRVGAGLLAALTSPWTALAGAIGGAVAIGRAYGRQVEQLKLSSVELAEEVERVFDRLSKFSTQSAAIRSQTVIGPLTQEDALDRDARAIKLALDAAASLRTELDKIGSGQALPRAVESTEALAQQLERARKAVADARLQDEIIAKQVQEAESTGNLLTTRQVFDVARSNERLGALRSAEDTLKNIEASSVRIGDRILVPTIEVRPLAAALGVLEQLDAAEAKATAGFADLVDVLRVLEGGALAGNKQLEQVITNLEQIRTKGEAAAESAEKSADISGVLSSLSRDTGDIQAQYAAALLAAESGRDYASAIREVQDAQDARIQTEEIISELTKDGAKVTAEQRAQIEQASRAYIDAARSIEDYLASLDAQARATDASQRAADRDADKARDAARRAQEQALQAAQAAAQRADQILTGLRLEIAAYSSTQEAVERLALEEDLRHLQVTDQTKERIRLALEEAQARRQLREVGAGIAGGFGDGVRTLAQTGDFGEAGAAALQGASERVFESSLARIEEAIAASFVDLTATPTIGETEIAVATRAVEAAVLQSAITISQAVAQGSAVSSASAAASAGADAARTGTVGEPGVQGPPTAENQSRNSGSGVGGAILGAGIGLALGMVASRMGRDSEDDPRGGQVGFDVIGASGRGVVYDQRRVTQYLSPTPRSQPRTRRQLAEERINRR